MLGVYYGFLVMLIKWENWILKVSKFRFLMEDDMSNVEICLKCNFMFCFVVLVFGWDF